MKYKWTRRFKILELDLQLWSLVLGINYNIKGSFCKQVTWPSDTAGPDQCPRTLRPRGGDRTDHEVCMVWQCHNTAIGAEQNLRWQGYNGRHVTAGGQDVLDDCAAPASPWLQQKQCPRCHEATNRGRCGGQTVEQEKLAEILRSPRWPRNSALASGWPDMKIRGRVWCVCASARASISKSTTSRVSGFSRTESYYIHTCLWWKSLTSETSTSENFDIRKLLVREVFSQKSHCLARAFNYGAPHSSKYRDFKKPVGDVRKCGPQPQLTSSASSRAWTSKTLWPSRLPPAALDNIFK